MDINSIFTAAADFAQQANNMNYYLGGGVAALALASIRVLKANEVLVARNIITGRRRDNPVQRTITKADGSVDHVGGWKFVNPLHFTEKGGRLYVGPTVENNKQAEMKTKDNATLDMKFDYTYEIQDGTKAFYNTNMKHDLEDIIYAEVWDAIKAEINSTDYEDVVSSLPDMQNRIIGRVNDSMQERYGVSLIRVYLKEPMPKEKRLEDALNQRIISSLKADAVEKDLERITNMAQGILKDMIEQHKENYPNDALPLFNVDEIYREAMHQIRVSDAVAAENKGIILDASKDGGKGGFATGFASASVTRAPANDSGQEPVQMPGKDWEEHGGPEHQALDHG